MRVELGNGLFKEMSYTARCAIAPTRLRFRWFAGRARSAASAQTALGFFCLLTTSGPLCLSEAKVKASLRLSSFDSVVPRWISIGSEKWGIRMNWLTSALAIIVLWGFSIWGMTDAESAAGFKLAQSWVTQNFTWFYIGTNDAWCVFLIYLCFSRFGDIRLGKDNERPRYGNLTWFSMLFTCGVATGLYYFGASEPLYFYRQPKSWKGYVGAYDYAVTKTAVENDAQRATQAIFIAFYHWGVHGWVPYVLLALPVGIASFRWGMPMTVRSAFFPLIGNHAYGVVGDVIDALSMATTTFGICTSLGLGVIQLSAGLQFLRNLQSHCQPKALCDAAGGRYDLNTHGAESCFDRTGPEETCQLSYLSTADAVQDTRYTLIWILTGGATLSVVTGLNTGIVTNSKVAFTLSAVLVIVCLLADNTPYLLNVMVQCTGYYIQYIIQIGFDCDAFQLLGYELASPEQNLLWGSITLKGKLEAAGVAPLVSTPDCGDRPNPCASGLIAMAAIAQGHHYLEALLMGPAQAAAAVALAALHPGASGIPCGAVAEGFASISSANAALVSSAVNKGYWEGGVPKFCPETTLANVMSWGECSAHAYECDAMDSYFADSSKGFMDWWTVFYWVRLYY